MKVVIPLAGYGSRLRPHTYSRPKPLMYVAGKPVLAHILDELLVLNPEEVVFIVGYLGDQIERYVRDHYAFRAHFVEQRELLGQAHALQLARQHIQGPVVVTFVDTIAKTDFSVVERCDADGIAFVKEVVDPRRFGVAIVENGYVSQFIEKPTTLEHRLTVIGLYYVRDGEHLIRAADRLIASGKQTRGEYFLTDTLQLMVNDGAKFRVAEVDVWEDCGKADAVLQTNRYLLAHGHDNAGVAAREGSLIIPPVNIAPTARIQRSIVGPNVTVAAGCAIENALVEDSIIDEGATLVDTILEGSIVGPHVSLRGYRQRLDIGDTSAIDTVVTPHRNEVV